MMSPPIVPRRRMSRQHRRNSGKRSSKVSRSRRDEWSLEWPMGDAAVDREEFEGANNEGTPEQNLWCAVIWSAAHDIIFAKTPALAKRYYNWFLSSNRDEFSFLTLCDLLNIEPDYFRRKVKPIYERRVHGHRGYPKGSSNGS